MHRQGFSWGLLSLSLTTKGSYMTQKQCTTRGPLGVFYPCLWPLKSPIWHRSSAPSGVLLGFYPCLWPLKAPIWNRSSAPSGVLLGSSIFCLWPLKSPGWPCCESPSHSSSLWCKHVLCKRIFLECFLLCVHYLLTNLITANNCKNFTVQKIHILQFGMQLSCLRSVLCVSRRLLSDVSSPHFVQLYSEIQYVRMCIIKLLQR